MARIMIVDDAAIMRRNIQLMLERAGHTVVAEAGNGAQAFHEYQVHKPDLVTMDITMPGINGVETVKNIVAEFPDALIIIISALSSKHLVLQAIKNGAKHYIIKPISAEKLLVVVNDVLVRYANKKMCAGDRQWD